MSLFGWSYPPGAAGDPFAPYNAEDGPCQVCGRYPDDCLCPRCPVCSVIGDPSCYGPGGHGLGRPVESHE